MSERNGRGRTFARRLLALAAGFAVFVGGCAWLIAQQNTRHTTPVKSFGTAKEIGRPGDDPNPRALYHGDYPSDAHTQERHVGERPARFSGYTTWVRSITRVPARKYVDGYRGDYLRVHVTVFNRDTDAQHVCACDFFIWTRAAGEREADAVKAPTLSPEAEIRSGARLDGDVYLYVGTVRGPYYVVYKPDAKDAFASSRATGAWHVTA